MTPQQIRTIQTAKRQLKLTDPEYRLVLRNAGGVESSKDLTRGGFEQVMAVLEERGFQRPDAPTYWRDRIGGGNRLSKAERMNHLILNLAKRVARYTLPQMIANVTGGQTHSLDGLDNRQRYNLIEAYKDLVARQERANRQGALFPQPATSNPQQATDSPEGSADSGVTDDPARTPATVTDDDRRRSRRKAPSQPGVAARAMPATYGPRGVVTDDDIPF